MQIKIEILKAGAILCHSEECKFRSECANHVTAGDWRSESGFSPELSVVDKSTGECSTFDRNGSEEPENVDDLGSGLLIWKNGVVRLAYQPDISLTSLYEVARMPVTDSVELLKEAGILTERGDLSPKYSSNT